MSIRNRLIGGISAVTLAGGMLAVAAPVAHAAVTPVGTCTDLLAQGKAKSATINPATGKAYGVSDNDDQDVAIATKGVDPNTLKGTDLGSCSFDAGLSTPDSSKPAAKGYSGSHDLVKWGTKLYSVESDCNTADTGDTSEWPLAGALTMKFADLTTAGKNQQLNGAIVVDGFTDPDNDPLTPSDVVSFHGLVTKGVALGADISGETEFDPIVKDKTVTYPGGENPGAYYSYQFDLGGALGCADAIPDNANVVQFQNGSVGGVSQLLGLPVAGISFSVGTP